MVTRTVLVTGATGGLGRVLVDQLAQSGHDVIATGRNATIGADLTGCHFIAADLASDPLERLVAGVDTVYHLAALSSPWGQYAAFERANITATERLLSAAAAQGCRAFIYASTPSIYTDTRHQIGITEGTPLPTRFANYYAATKYAAEQTVLGHQGSMATVALRPRAIVSPFDTALLPRLMRAADRGRMPLPGAGDALVELTDARDVTAALIAASNSAEKARSQAFNISGGAPRRFREIADYVFAKLSKDVLYVPLGAGLVAGLGGLMEAVARMLPGQPEPPLTRYSAMALGWSQTFDLAAARDVLGWSPLFSPEAAIDWALEAKPHA